MRDAPQVQRVAPGLFVWWRYAPDVKAELFSTAIVAPGGAFLIDPIPCDDLLGALGPAPVAGLIITNENHARHAVALAQELGAPLFAHRDAQTALGLESGCELADAAEFSPGLTAIALEGAPAGEVAIHSAAEGGTLIVGDALINMGAYGFALLPAKYCSNQKRMRQSLRKLLDYDFTRILFAHGLPVASDAKRRLAELLEAG